jgi:hypothetical protein
VPGGGFKGAGETDRGKALTSAWGVRGRAPVAQRRARGSAERGHVQARIGSKSLRLWP